ncbi:MAG: DUF2202 domain-containing protein [Xanthomonadales bacterium]|nr:DUF2202 domain-containing protein [Xanthomonadales bacterium]
MRKSILFCLVLLIFNPIIVVGQQGNQNVGELDSNEESTLVFLREEEKLARDAYFSMHELWGKPIFSNISESEQKHMDAMLKKLVLFEIEDPVSSNEPGKFSNPQLDQLYDDLLDSGSDSLLDAYQMGAFIEEMSIQELLMAIEETDEPPLMNAYSNVLAGSRNHLRAFVGHIEAMGIDYSAQYLGQDEVDDIVGDFALEPAEGFVINRGLNDAWFNPETGGQGFFITVYPEPELLFLGWVTFDTERPNEEVTAKLGGPGQRWLTAQGTFAGSQAELTITNTTEGVFDSDTPQVASESFGSILLQFDNCASGIVIYDIPSLQLTGSIPIRRVAPDQPGLCTNAQEPSP